MKWLLVIAFIDPHAGTLVQAEIPMPDEIACEAAKAETKVVRRHGKTIQWLDALCEPRR